MPSETALLIYYMFLPPYKELLDSILCPWKSPAREFFLSEDHRGDWRYISTSFYRPDF